MRRTWLTFLAAWVLTAAVVVLSADPGTPLWTAPVGGLGAGFLAAAVVAMEESLLEDALKGVIFGFLGGSLLLLDLPGWVAWPMILGPWTGFLGNRRRAEPVPADD